MTSLRDDRDILRLDLRGHNNSIYRGKIGLEIWADDIAAILRQERISKAIVGGHCLGANVAAMFALRHPEMAAGVILIEPMLRDALTGTLRKLKPFVPLLRIVIILLRFFNRLGFYRRQIESLDLRELDRQFRARLTQPGGNEALVKRYASPLHDLAIMPAANFLQDLVEVTRPLPLNELKAPVLALLSTGRTFADPERTQSELSSLPSRKELITVDAKHWIPTEQPLVMRKHVENWCRRKD